MFVRVSNSSLLHEFSILLRTLDSQSSRLSIVVIDFTETFVTIFCTAELRFSEIEDVSIGTFIVISSFLVATNGSIDIEALNIRRLERLRDALDSPAITGESEIILSMLLTVEISGVCCLSLGVSSV